MKQRCFGKPGFARGWKLKKQGWGHPRPSTWLLSSLSKLFWPTSHMHLRFLLDSLRGRTPAGITETSRNKRCRKPGIRQFRDSRPPSTVWGHSGQHQHLIVHLHRTAHLLLHHLERKLLSGGAVGDEEDPRRPVTVARGPRHQALPVEVRPSPPGRELGPSAIPVHAFVPPFKALERAQTNCFVCAHERAHEQNLFERAFAPTYKFCSSKVVFLLLGSLQQT